MKYYNTNTDRLIDEEELIAKYGSLEAIPKLGIYNLSIQPDYIPVGYNKVNDTTYYPIESYLAYKAKAEQALQEAGYTEAQAAELLDL